MRVTDFIDDHFRHFNAGTLRKAADGYERHLEGGGRMMVTLAGAMSTAELGRSLAEMIRRDKVHAITCTAANLEEDVFNLVAHDEYETVPDWRNLTPEREKELERRGMNRVTDVCIPEEAAIRAIETEILELWRSADEAGERRFPHEFLYDLLREGRVEDRYQADPNDAWLLAAAERDLPLFVPGWEDSTLGNVFVSHVIEGDLSGHGLVRSGLEYMDALADWYCRTTMGRGVRELDPVEAGGEDAVDARTGDVLDFNAVALDADGNPIEDMPVRYTMQAVPDDNLGPGATGQINKEGKFVAQEPGLYTIVASSGTRVAQQQVRIVPRNADGELEVVGRGKVQDVHTSDLWVWEAQDGRDYALTGTWGANGAAYFWDVTDPANITPVDTVVVDARTVNDVKVSEDGTLCVIGREGASDRKNGIVLLDCTDPTDVSIITEYTEQLTGGVHNLFIYQDHVYALSNGRRYEIINIEDRANPQRVSTVELDTPGHAIHDVWVERGIAFSSNWDDGVVLTDVGAGIAGGSPSNPQQISSYTYPSGWNHAAFPYWDEETGKFYVIAGDEAFPNGLYVDDQPTIPAGWIHFIDFTDMQNPKEVARYQIPEAGSHNFWVEGDTLYVAYYNGGLRVVDISGRLMGNLYEQGREIAHFKPYDPEGRIANAPMTWGPQPHKGHIFISDWNSGLWALELQQPDQEPEMVP